jgi:hypothetical protein
MGKMEKDEEGEEVRRVWRKMEDHEINFLSSIHREVSPRVGLRRRGDCHVFDQKFQVIELKGA